jgi:hypothetical protein
VLFCSYGEELGLSEADQVNPLSLNLLNPQLRGDRATVERWKVELRLSSSSGLPNMRPLNTELMTLSSQIPSWLRSINKHNAEMSKKGCGHT